MKKTVTLTESELVKVINRIVESYTDDTYDEEDYVEVFFDYFRPWVKKNHGDEIGSYPFSYLTKKYMKEFATDNGINPEHFILGYRGTIGNASKVGREFVKMGKHKLPSLRSQDKFTEKFKKPLDYFVSQLNLPDFMTINFSEETPYNVNVKLLIDWEELIKYQGEKISKPDEIRNELKKKIEDFLGVETGNPTHGQLAFNFSKVYVGVDEWIKKSLNKEIKKKIKELPNAKRILHAIKFETSSYSLGGELKFSFRSWNGKSDFMKSVRELLKSMGYNIEILKLDH